MNVVKLSWYLCVLFLIGALLTSAITVLPGLETWRDLFAGLCLASSLLFGGLAILFTILILVGWIVIGMIYGCFLALSR